MNDLIYQNEKVSINKSYTTLTWMRFFSISSNNYLESKSVIVQTFIKSENAL